MVLDLPGERACEVAQDLGEPLSSAGVGRVMALGDLMGCASLYTPGFSPLQSQRVEVEDAHKAHWADLTAFPQQMSHKLRKGRT